ncbi:cytochrome c-type biogenesis protein CcsB [Candidatus Electrothrix marina]|uniref:Cytochrome c-type biogenesis protein CcsB n=2 Tax=Candidatus Electrothrix marina TaxID=1859130 RepID=A0A3S3RDB4_9BACT|nr:cytochrome c-type biogenesis protein CcsB [Candidatus Electrothrix marina]
MSYLLFQAAFAAYLAAAVIYTVFFFSQKAQVRNVARIVFIVAASLHTVNIIFRYIEAGHTPITSIHETISFFAWSVSWCHLSFRWRYTVKNSGIFTVVFVFLLMLTASSASREIFPLPLEMQSWLLPIHASISIIAAAFLTLAAIGGIMYLLQERELKQKRFGFFFSRLPSLDTLDKLNQHCISIGFPLMTLGMFAGYIWARQIWGGRPWHWNPKIIMSMITWLLYAGLMHQRFTLGWRGRRAARITVIAFFAVLLTLWFMLRGGL